MAWDDKPPTKAELNAAPAWDSAPPTKEEIGSLSWKERLGFGQDPKEKEAMLTKAMNEQVGNPEERKKESTKTIQKGLDLLPVAGSIGGGVVGGAAGLVTPIPGAAMAGEYVGAGAGGALGEVARYGGEKYLLNKDMTNESLPKRMAVAGAAGVIGQITGNAVNAAGMSFAKSGIQDVSQSLARPGAEQIAAAAAKLGVKPTQGMMTSDYTVRNLEDSLGQSPSVPGSMIRGEQQPVRDAIKGAAEGSLSDASTQSAYDTGRQLKTGVVKNLEDRYEPISNAYNEIEGHTKNVPIDQKGIARIANNIRNMPEAKFEGSEIANKFADHLGNVENVNDIKILKTQAGNILRDQNASFTEKQIASKIVDKLDQAQTNTITRQAVSIAREGAPGGSVLKGGALSSSEDGISFKHPDVKTSGEFMHPETLDERLDMTPEEHGLEYERPFYVESAEVNPEKQGQGLGSAALHKLEKEATKQGADGFVLNASPQGVSFNGKMTAKDESRLNDLVNFYKKNGYEELKHEGNNVLMHKPLGAASAPLKTAADAAGVEGENIGKKLVGDIKSTNQQYKGLLQDARAFGKGSGLTKANKGMAATLQDIQSATPEEMSKAMIDPNNADFMKFVKEKMPKEFDLARQNYLAELQQKSGGDPNRILKLTEKLGPEAKEMIFGKANVENLANAGILQKAIPGKVGSSDTSRGMSFKDMLNPMQNVNDLGRYGLLKGKGLLPKASGILQKARYPAQGLVNRGLIDDRQD